MSQRDGFTGGFLAGIAVGGLVGAVVGALIAADRNKETEAADGSLLNSSALEAKAGKARKRQLKDSDSIEIARRSLEDKIAQLNTAIDEVRQQLGTVNGNGSEIQRDSVIAKEP